MKALILILFSTFLVGSCLITNDSKKKQLVSVKAVSQGTYGMLGSSEPRGYYLVKVNLTNTSGSTVKFLVSDCLIARWFVTDSKDLSVCINDCPNNSDMMVSLDPGQQFITMLLLTSQVRIDNYFKIGFVFLTEKNARSFEIFKKLNESLETMENVIWSDPFYVRTGEGTFFDIVKK